MAPTIYKMNDSLYFVKVSELVISEYYFNF